MNGSRPVIKWVSDSAVRSELLHAIVEQSRQTDALLAATEASQSAVYAALNDLDRRNLVIENDRGWQPTGQGQLVADSLAQQSAFETLFDGETCYWQRHDVSVIPNLFRLRMGTLADHEVVRITNSDPRRVIRLVSNRIEDAESVQILAPIYQDEYATAMPDNTDSRLILSHEVVDSALGETVRNPAAERPEETRIRIGPAPVGLTVLPDAVLVSFPELDGSYDTSSEVLVETEAAVQWGRDLFDHYWEQAMPVPDS